MERCFTMLVDTDNFLELDYNLVAKILESSKLFITSEVEVYNAADRWLSYNIKDRSKFAKRLLLKVRLHLLSEHALKNLLNEYSLFAVIDECISIVKTISATNTEIFEEKSGVNYTNRYCNQNNFNMLIFGGDHPNKLVNNVTQINGNNPKDVKALHPMERERKCFKVVCVKGEVYVLGGYNTNLNLVWSVEKYSPSTHSWSVVADMFDNRDNFCACAFMDKIFVVGGCTNTAVYNYSLEFDTKDNHWRRVTGMKEARADAACAVFEERIIVSGGWDTNGDDLKTVESYDVITDEWSSMPNMTDSKVQHSLVALKNKLYAIGRGTDTCEFFDNCCKKFVAIKSPPTIFLRLNKAISIGSKIYVFQDDSSSYGCYDVDKDKWSEEPFEVTNKLEDFSCVKLPWY